MVCSATRLSPSNQARPGETTRSTGHAIEKTRCRQGRGGQSKPDPTTPGTVHSFNGQPSERLGRTNRTDQPSTTTLPSPLARLEASASHPKADNHNKSQGRAMAPPRTHGSTPRRTAQKKHPLSPPRTSYHGTPRTRRNNQEGQTNLLVASHE